MKNITDAFGPHFFKVIDIVNEFISQIKTELKGDYYNNNHLISPIDKLNEDALAIIRNVISLRKKLSYLAVKKTNYFTKQLFELYDNDPHRGKEALFFLLQLLKDEWEELEIRRIINAMVKNAQSQSQKMRILEDIQDLKLHKRLMRRL